MFTTTTVTLFALNYSSNVLIAMRVTTTRRSKDDVTSTQKMWSLWQTVVKEVICIICNSIMHPSQRARTQLINFDKLGSQTGNFVYIVK